MTRQKTHRLAFCITELNPGGAEQALVEIVTRLDRGKWSPRVISLGPRGSLADRLDSAAIPVTCLNARSNRDLLVLNRLRRDLARNRPTILQTFLFHANIAGRLAGWAAGVPHIVSGLRVAEREHGWHNRLDRWTRNWAHQYVAVSQGVAEFAINQLAYTAERLTVIPNGIDVDAYRNLLPQDWTELGLPGEAQIILAAGRLHPQKGFDVLIRAVAPLLQSRPDWFVVIAGEGPLRQELTSLIATAGLAGRILLPGFTPRLGHWLRGCQLFVLPSLWEGMPNVVLQAMACARPVVATRVEGIPELLESVAPESIVNPGSEEELRHAIDDQMQHVGYRSATGKSLQQNAEKRFTWNSVVAAYEALYSRLLSGSAGTGG